jgi:hypothetical protein
MRCNKSPAFYMPRHFGFENLNVSWYSLQLFKFATQAFVDIPLR